ncbi:hypothetical protein AWM70_17035 [Paenibacillus yonginensis]|uniref:Uncharacterized protein n=1 Tax=Paenibacillus yonginensis TaxID=1462996 RepID=A0A1B1N3U1_9BACL|nr:CBO0543 family protein [Paenibacillus yonginensis]ANS76076.1 hypothetical protein AWM70_17035 [Paenibacillus yonginensis]
MEKDKADMRQIHELQEQLSRARWDYWITEVFMSWQWLFLLLSTLVFTLIWLRCLRKDNLMLILINGLIAFIFCILADTIGGEFQLWDYPRMLLPWGARMFCIDWMIAVVSMLAYQYFQRWKSFAAAAAGISIVFAGVLEQLAKVMNIYMDYLWSSWYSLPIYFLLFCGLKAATDGIGRKANPHFQEGPVSSRKS